MENSLDKRLKFEVEPRFEDIRHLEESIYSFNEQVTGISDGKFFGLFLRDADGTAIVGVHGWTWGKTCYVHLLFVPTHLRNHVLYRRRRQTGGAIKCYYRHMTSSPEFYQGLGFEIVARVPDYPHGHQSLRMLKRLAARAPGVGVPGGQRMRSLRALPVYSPWWDT